jgi:hypothetical protein
VDVGIGTRRWFERVGPDAPLYFDPSHKKTGKSMDRYRRYRNAKTTGEYLLLHASGHTEGGSRMVHGLPHTPLATRDFVFDFERGYVRLLASGALMSFGSSLRTGVLGLSEESLATLGDSARADILATVGAWVDYDTESDMLSVLELTKFVEDRRFVLSVVLPELQALSSSHRPDVIGSTATSLDAPTPLRDRLYDMSRRVALLYG